MKEDLNCLETEGEPNDLQFLDLFELKKIQQLQDLLAETHGVASVITDPQGVPITKPSNFTRFALISYEKQRRDVRTAINQTLFWGVIILAGQLSNPV